MLEWLSLPPFPNLQIYIPKKSQQRVPVFGTGTKEVWKGREGCALEMGLVYSIFLQITHPSYNLSLHILGNE